MTLKNSTVQDMIATGRLSTDPSAKIDPTTIVGVDGNPIKTGNYDPNIIGLDSKPSFSYRPLDAYPDHPDQIVNAEHRYVLPLAKFIGDAVGVVPVDEHAYNKVLPAIQSRSLLVVLNQRGLSVDAGVATWFGLVLMCRRHPVAMVQFKEQLATEKVGISQIRLWRSKEARYHIEGSRKSGVWITREVASATLLNYLKQEGVVDV